ncbi:hypothetical protein KBC03_01470 [Patescibacteria group bacterium]|nr:hypothetical protein [Patescibacteria group bacterium]
MLAVGLDLLGTKGKNTINKIFYRNIEELIAYPLGFILNAIKTLFGR